MFSNNIKLNPLTFLNSLSAVIKGRSKKNAVPTRILSGNFNPYLLII
jgi:hypothetical protein